MARRYEFLDAAWELIKDLAFPEQKRGRPRKRSRWLLADKGCRRAPASALRSLPDPAAHYEAQTQAWVPRLFDRPQYRQRNIIERMFGWLKESRRMGTRYGWLARRFSAMATLACTPHCLRQYFSYKT